MTSTPESPDLDGSDLAELREQIDALKAIPEEELVNPLPTRVQEHEPVPTPSDAVGSEKWNEPASDESLDQS